jgi:hypothetical protein
LKTASNCDQASWQLTLAYYNSILKDQLKRYGNLMVDAYFDEALDKLAAILIKKSGLTDSIIESTKKDRVKIMPGITL